MLVIHWTTMIQIRTMITRNIQRTQTPTRVWTLTLRMDLDLSSKSRTRMSLIYMLLIVLYLGTRYDVYGFNTLRAMIITPHRNRGGVIFSLQFVCVSVYLSVCLCVRLCLWRKFQPNGCTDLNAVFAKRLHSTLARTLLKLVTLGQRWRSKWRNTPFFFTILC